MGRLALRGGAAVSDDRLQTAKEIAEWLSVPVTWVRHHTRTGEIPCEPLPGRYKRYSRPVIEAWLDERRQGPGRKHRPSTQPPEDL
jgi:hypothetical protein